MSAIPHTIPHAPEPVEQLRARYPAALVHLFRYADARADGCAGRPLRENVFDFANGQRLIVGRVEQFRPADGAEELWETILISASFKNDSEVFRQSIQAMELMGRPGLLSYVKDKSVEAIRELLPADTFARLEWAGWMNPNQVPHWIIWERRAV